MKNLNNLPNIIPIFPLSNFIIFPHTTVPLNIFEPRYVDMVKESMKTNKIIGLIQPKINNISNISDLHTVGCLGEITNFKNLSDGRYLIELKGLNRFNILKEINNNKAYREYEISFKSFENDFILEKKKTKII